MRNTSAAARQGNNSGGEFPPEKTLEDYVAGIASQNLPHLMNVKRVAAMLDLDTRRIYDMVQMGELAGVRHGVRGLRVFSESVLDWLRRGGSTGARHRESGN